MAFEGSCTVKGGMPLWAVCIAGVDDGPNGREYWSEVASLHWLKKDGTKGKEITQAMYASIEKYDEFWQAEVTEQVSEALAYEEYQKKNGDDQNIPFDMPC